MRIQLVSDLHLEFPDADMTLKNVNGATDLLILSGDICIAKHAGEFRPFFERCAKAFPQVVYVLGNHEHYRSDIIEAPLALKEMLGNLENIHLLNNAFVSIGGYVVFGATLWTDCNKADPNTFRALASGMNDFRLISWKAREHWKLRPSDTVDLHNATLMALEKTITATKQPIIVVGHHAPSKKSCHPRYFYDVELNGGYSSDLEPFISAHTNRISLWTHGHTHDSFDYTVAQTRIVANPRGYWLRSVNENARFDPNLVLELP